MKEVRYSDPNDEYLSKYLSGFVKRYGRNWVVIAGGEVVAFSDKEGLSRLIKKARRRFPKETRLISPIPREEEVDCILSSL
jgi:hypothetical protein